MTIDLRFRTSMFALGLLILPVSKASAADFKFDGSVSIGGRVKGDKSGEAQHEAKLDLSTKRKDGTRAVIELEGESDDDRVKLREAFIDHRFAGDGEKDADTAQSTLVFGQTKKILGLEYENGDKARPLLRRSIVYRRMEEFGYVGRELIVRYETESTPTTAGYSLGGGYARSLDAHLLASLRSAGVDGEASSPWRTGAWILLQRDRIDGGNQFAYALMTSLWRRTESRTTEVEAVYGLDPFESEFHRLFGDKKPRNFAGLKLLHAWRTGSDLDKGLEPITSASVLVHDVDDADFNSLSLLLGMNWRFSKELVLGFNVEGIATNSRLDKAKRAYEESNVGLELSYYF